MVDLSGGFACSDAMAGLLLSGRSGTAEDWEAAIRPVADIPGGHSDRNVHAAEEEKFLASLDLSAAGTIARGSWAKHLITHLNLSAFRRPKGNIWAGLILPFFYL